MSEFMRYNSRLYCSFCSRIQYEKWWVTERRCRLERNCNNTLNIFNEAYIAFLSNVARCTKRKGYRVLISSTYPSIRLSLHSCILYLRYFRLIKGDICPPLLQSFAMALALKIIAGKLLSFTLADYSVFLSENHFIKKRAHGTWIW